MAKELVDGQERFDGYVVTLYDGRFSGTFELPENVGAGLEYDEVVTFVVTATVGKATIDSTRLGDLRRTNTMKVLSAVPVPYSEVNNVLDFASGNVEKESGFVFEDEDEPVLTEEVFTPAPMRQNEEEFSGPKLGPVNFTSDGPERRDKVLADFLEVG